MPPPHRRFEKDLHVPVSDCSRRARWLRLCVSNPLGKGLNEATSFIHLFTRICHMPGPGLAAGVAELEMISALELPPGLVGEMGKHTESCGPIRAGGAPVELGTRHGGKKEASTVLSVRTVPGRTP